MSGQRIVHTIGSLITGMVVAGVFYFAYHRFESQPETPKVTQETTTSNQTQTQSLDRDPQIDVLMNELNHYREWATQLEYQIIDLESRLLVLEEAVTASPYVSNTVASLVADAAAGNSSETPPKPTGVLSVSTLVQSGIEMQLANEIVKRKNDFDMRQLELRDQAIRDGTFGQEAYFSALRELNSDAPDLRSELGDNAYDRFLYATGQPNRVVVTSVIQGSPAEQAGIDDGDLILDYDDKRIFTWSELRDATSEGEKGEYTQLTVQRKSNRLSFLVPRGPLGVRMGNKSIDPLADDR